MKNASNISFPFLAVLLVLLFLVPSISTHAQDSVRDKGDSGPEFEVEIRHYYCSSFLHSLLVYNPEEHNIFQYASDQFDVLWYRNGELVHTQALLKCTGAGIYRVVVSSEVHGPIGTATIKVHNTIHYELETAEVID